jgi:hypothetical protein
LVERDYVGHMRTKIRGVLASPLRDISVDPAQPNLELAAGMIRVGRFSDTPHREELASQSVGISRHANNALQESEGGAKRARTLQ